MNVNWPGVTNRDVAERSGMSGRGDENNRINARVLTRKAFSLGAFDFLSYSGGLLVFRGMSFGIEGNEVTVVRKSQILKPRSSLRIEAQRSQMVA